MGTTTVGTIELITKIDTGDYKRGAKEIDNANKDISSSSDKTSNNLSKAWSVASKAVIAGTTAAAAGVIALSIASIKSTAQLEQSLGGSEVVFGDFSEKIQKLAKESAVVMGTSQRQYLDTANKMASLFQGAGFTVEKSFDLSSAAMQRATDVATAMGISTDMALESIAGAAKGNFTMMDNLGVAMSATSIEAYALAKGITKSYDAMTQAEKIGYAMEMFLEKTAKYAGNYAKENDTLSGSFQTLKGSWENFLSGVEGSDKQVVQAGANVTRVLGREIPRIMSSLANGVSGVYAELKRTNPEFKKYSDIGEDAASNITKTIRAVMPLAPLVVAATASWAAYAVTVNTVRTATQLYTAAQVLLNRALTANPVGLLVGALTGLVTIFALVNSSSDNAKASQDRLNKAREYGKTANDNLINSENALKDAQLRVEGSTIAVERAQLNLTNAEAQYGIGSLEAREAALQLKNAQRELEQANTASKNATDSNTQAQKDFAKAKDEIVAAQNAVANATGNSASQYERLANTAKQAAKAQEEIRKQGGSSTPQQQLQASGFPSLNIPGGRASGGPVSANTPYFVGENPDGSLNSTSELFVPRSSGKIINSKDLQSSLGSSSSTENNIANVNIYSEVDGERWLRRLTGDSEIVSHGLVPQQQYMGNA